MKRTDRFPFSRRRGSVLLTSLLLATALALGLGGYMTLARSSLITAQRTFFVRDAFSLAEAGLEEALDSFLQMDAGATSAAAWAGWTLTGANATRTLAPMDRDGRALGTVKIYVEGYNGTSSAPFAVAQATIVPFDGSRPIVRTAQISLEKKAYFMRSLVGRQGLTMSGNAATDSYNSNPSGNPAGPWAAYSAGAAKSNSLVIVPTGTVNITGSAIIRGNLSLGVGITKPAASKVTGTITNDFVGTFPMPVYPTAASVTRSYDLGTTMPTTLPVAGHLPASDGRYYYFCRNTSVRSVAISSNRAVTIVGTATSVGTAINLTSGASLSVYVDGAITIGSSALTNGNWAGAMQIFTSTSANCSLSGNGSIYACVYAPNAALSCSGNGMLVGSFVARTISASGNMKFHYDEALQLPGGGYPWTVTGWYERRSATDRAALAALTSNFLQ